MTERDPKPHADEDVVLLHGPTDDGEGVRVLRARPGRPLEVGEVRAAKEGKPLMGAEMVSLKPRAGKPFLCDVEVIAGGAPEPRAAANATPSSDTDEKSEISAPHLGPAQVATEAYRASWERIFGGGAGGALN